MLHQQTDNRFFILPYVFDIGRLKHDLMICEEEQWIAHYNRKDYIGDWNGIALRSVSGLSSDLVTESPDAFSDTPLLGQCAYFREILEQFQCPIETVRLLALSPGSSIREHRDPGLGYEYGRFRLHIPILSDKDVDFVVDGYRLQMEAGQCWYANFNLPHYVKHGGITRRIHLVIDGIRNGWTDDLFTSAGYNHDLEKKSKTYDHATKMGMIKQLRLMDTETARAIIATLESSDTGDAKELVPGIQKNIPPLEEGWIPESVETTGHGLSYKWVFIGNKPFSEPFFHDTLSRARSNDFNKDIAFRTTPQKLLFELACKTDSISPTALVFHVSRCGSTLLSQLLCEDEQNIVLSEVPLLDALLRLPYQDHHIPQQIIDEAILSVVRLLGKKRTSHEKHLFIKTDSWHIFFYNTLRRLYPQTPFIFLYRRPDQVIRSHQKQRGIQSIPTTLESGFTGIPYDPSNFADLDGYFIKLLEQIFKAFIGISAQDPNTFLINYNEGTAGMREVLASATGYRYSNEILRKMESRSRFHAKRPNEWFEEKPFVEAIDERVNPLMKLFSRLEESRK